MSTSGLSRNNGRMSVAKLVGMVVTPLLGQVVVLRVIFLHLQTVWVWKLDPLRATWLLLVQSLAF